MTILSRKSPYILAIVLLTVVYNINNLKGYYFQYKLKNLMFASSKLNLDGGDKKYEGVSIKNNYKVVYVTTGGGEYSLAENFKAAGENLGWIVKIYYQEITGYEEEILAFDPDLMV